MSVVQHVQLTWSTGLAFKYIRKEGPQSEPAARMTSVAKSGIYIPLILLKLQA
jgi:hypothetical protein